MLGKLFKHDMRALSKTVLYVLLAVIALSLLATATTAIELRMSANNSPMSLLGDSPIYAMFTTMQTLTVIAIAASGLLVLFFICHHFYRNMFCDEGYLTHTLPVRPSALLWSKLLSGQLWILLSTISIGLAIAIFLLGGTSPDTLFNTGLFAEMFDLFKTVEIGQEVVGLLLLFLLGLVLASFSSMLQIYLALTIGCAIGKKHRVAIAVGMYFGISFVLSMLSSALSAPVLLSRMFGVATIAAENAETVLVNTFSGALWLQAGISAVTSAVFFVVTEYLMRRKLNLQ